MWSHITNRGEPVYTPLHRAQRTKHNSQVKFSIIFVLVLGLFTASTYLAYEIGKASMLTPVEQQLHKGFVTEAFTANPDFIGRPTADKELAWRSLFPTEGGFFVHPKLAPRKSDLAVFHQLHCLEAIWHQWWMLYDNSTEPHIQSSHPGTAHRNSLGHHHRSPDPVHVNHCIELLRLQLMCRPDLTVEIAKEDTGGVTGFGTEHQCRNWGDVMRWTTQWQDYMLSQSD